MRVIYSRCFTFSNHHYLYLASYLPTQLLSVESSSDLNDNQWHTVQMERNRKEARLRVDQNTPTIRAESSQGHRALSLGDNPLYVGSDVDYKVSQCL